VSTDVDVAAVFVHVRSQHVLGDDGLLAINLCLDYHCCYHAYENEREYEYDWCEYDQQSHFVVD